MGDLVCQDSSVQENHTLNLKKDLKSGVEAKVDRQLGDKDASSIIKNYMYIASKGGKMAREMRSPKELGF